MQIPLVYVSQTLTAGSLLVPSHSGSAIEDSFSSYRMEFCTCWERILWELSGSQWEQKISIESTDMPLQYAK